MVVWELLIKANTHYGVHLFTMIAFLNIINKTGLEVSCAKWICDFILLS
uniref:Uncharacterized protein n=1 Tax=Arundo donax TaxID=35708 RepID=A0A0A9A3C2_ARUDO